MRQLFRFWVWLKHLANQEIVFTVSFYKRETMASVTISPEYQVSIPPEVREKLNIQPGQKLEILVYDGQMHFVPVVPVESLFGIFKGFEIPYEREKRDRPI